MRHFPTLSVGLNTKFWTTRSSLRISPVREGLGSEDSPGRLFKKGSVDGPTGRYRAKPRVLPLNMSGLIPPSFYRHRQQVGLLDLGFLAHLRWGLFPADQDIALHVAGSTADTCT